MSGVERPELWASTKILEPGLGDHAANHTQAHGDEQVESLMLGSFQSCLSVSHDLATSTSTALWPIDDPESDITMIQVDTRKTGKSKAKCMVSEVQPGHGCDA
jgi:hypothetical protein